MTKLKRFTGKVFGGSATAVGDDPQIAQFGSALANTFVGTTDPEIIQQLPAWGQGWIGAVTPTQQYPALPEMTGAMKVLSHQICGILQQGVSTWDSGTIYYTGNFCSKNGIVYVSLSDLNQGNDPETDTTNWRSYGGADIDLSNLSSQGQNIANWSTNVTNCITEIPQRIKLELNNGTLTLKAGSIVTVPYGTEDRTAEFPIGSKFLNDYFEVYETSWDGEKFFVYAKNNVNITNDTAHTGSSTTFNYINMLTGAIYRTIKTESGTGSPSTTYCGYYNIDTNLIKSSGSTTSYDGAVLTLPLCIASSTASDTTWYGAINQVFNGIGYIGSTVWVDKGVKVLIPNGRNEDGTLNNVEYTTDKVITFTNKSWTGAATAVLGINYLAIWSDNDYRYNEELNTTKYRDNTTISIVVKLGNCTLTSGIVSNFNPKQPFRATDYQDVIKKSGDTMTGALIIQNPDNYDFTATTAPSSAIVAGAVAIADKNGNIVTRLQNYFNQYNNMITHITANRSVGGATKTASLQLFVDSEGLDQFAFPRCTTMPTTTSSASYSRVAVVVQNYRSGTSWYRVWSDGWKEQGGMTDAIANAGTTTVTFLKAFSNTNYTVVLGTTKINQTASGTYNDFVNTKTASNFTVVSGSGGNATCAWYACGY